MKLDLDGKHKRLNDILIEAGKTAGKIIVAFSSGVDSTLLVKVAQDVLGDRVTAATINSPMFYKTDLQEASDLANLLGLCHKVLDVNALESPVFAMNSPERCYFCKKLSFDKMLSEFTGQKLVCLLDGANADDEKDWRPGKKAARELGVRSPLSEAGLSKPEIRELARKLGLPNWDKPSAACLASRIPYGEEINYEKLSQVAMAEEYLLGIGFRQVRVRHHGDVARIEVPSEDAQNILARAEEIASKLKEAGFFFVSLDLSGFISGSMNAVLDR